MGKGLLGQWSELGCVELLKVAGVYSLIALF